MRIGARIEHARLEPRGGIGVRRQAVAKAFGEQGSAVIVGAALSVHHKARACTSRARPAGAVTTVAV